ncbi:hypothetical protein [Legionella santicrucis]|uniref:hypothetical protein n=1 Tax=Legionella santicrucis TaxID=45074 RepID=UPI000B2EFD75|nr:hypothetical protein [Legionella santicrucis]
MRIKLIVRKQLDQGIIAFDALGQGAAINAMNKKGQSALHLATLNADKKTISKTHCSWH